MQRSRSPEALRQASPVGLRHVQCATWQHRGSAWAGSRSVCRQVRVWTRVSTGPRLGLVPGSSMFCPRTWGPHCGRAGPPPGGGGGTDPILGVRLAHVEVLDQPWRSGLFIKGSGALLWGSGLTVDALEYITFSRHVAAPDPPMWWIRALLWTQSSRPRLGQVVASSHTQHLYHATKR
jgi:hypothetical protein